jgi:uncharacterized protein DUF262
MNMIISGCTSIADSVQRHERSCMAKRTESSLADKLFPQQEESHADSILQIPPEQRRLHTETYDFSITTLYEYMTSSTRHIYIPEFQRRYVWGKAQASRLIESLIIQCPIPVIYLSQERDERFSVIDGNQRLQSIRKFLNNEFSLVGLTAYPELEGLSFEELDPRFQRHITNRTLRCIVIMKDTHPQVKFDVFERLNSGAVELSAQELRHGIYHGRFITWLGQAAKDEKWRRRLHAGGNKRMKAEEFLLRFLAFHFRIDEYQKPLEAFLNSFVEYHRDDSDEVIEALEALFEKTLEGVDALFGDLTFAIYDYEHEYEIVSSFNAALFDAEMLAVSRTNLQANAVTPKKREAFIRDLGELFFDDEFRNAIGRATSDVNQVKRRVTALTSLVQKHF